MNILLLTVRKAIFTVAIATILTCAAHLLLQKAHINLPTQVSADTIFVTEKPANISDPATVADEANNIEVYRALAPGVVLISTGSARGGGIYEKEGGDERAGTGSGSILDKNGHVLTNAHVVEDAQKLTVNLGGDKVFPARVIGIDADTDLAVIKIDAPAELLTVVPVGDSENLQVGQKVLAIGNPFGLDRTLTTGVISGLQRPIRARNNRPIEGAIQTDASINPGNSGGPLLDSHGRMIGVNSQILSPSGASNGIGFAIPANIVKRIVPQLIQHGEVRRPRLGVGTREVSELTAHGVRLPIENGLLVMTIAPNSAAEAAGLRATSQSANGGVVLGDIIIAIDNAPIASLIDNAPIASLDDLYRAVDKHQIDETIQVEIYRDGKKIIIAVKLQALASEKTQPEKRTKTPRRF